MTASGISSPLAAPGAPAVRARFLQRWLSFPERYDPSAAVRLAKLVSESKRDAIMTASSLDWLPIELDLEIVDAVAEAIGEEHFGELARAYFLDIMPQGSLGALVELGVQLMGRSPEAFLRWWDKGWGAVYRDCGTAVGSVQGAVRGRLLFEHMPRVCLHSAAFVQAIQSSAYGLYTLTGHQGTVRVAALRVDDGYLELELAWRAPNARRAQ